MAVASGVGVVFNATLPVFLEACPGVIDYVELIPETLWTDRGRGAADRYEDVPAAVGQLERLADDYPIACHGIGLSIGSVLPLDAEHLARLRRVTERYGVERFSEHLGFTRVADGLGGDRHLGVALPLPCDEAVLAWLTGRVSEAQDRLGQPMLLENGVRHTPFVEEDMSEPAFLKRLANATGCGVLLDLHNLHVDCRNNGWTADDYLAELDLGIVREIHVAGGSELGGVYTDSHSGPAPAPVWALLRALAPLCPNLEGITFEFNDSYFPRFGAERLAEELAALREVWRGRHVA